MERSLEPHFEEPRIDEPSQMVAQRGGRQVDVRLDVACRSATITSLHDEAQDGQAKRMAQRAELGGVTVEFRRHRTNSNKFEVVAQGG